VRANARIRERWDSDSPHPPHRAVAIASIDRERARPRSHPSRAFDRCAIHTRTRAIAFDPARDPSRRDVAPRDSTAIARRGGARHERRSTARDGDDARTRVARRATGTARFDAAEATGGDDRGRAREGREARERGDGWAQLRDVRRSEDVEMAKDG